MGWIDRILNINVTPEEEGGDAEEENLLENYGTVTLEQVLASEKTYIAEQERKAQDTYMLYQCLMSSLSSEAKKKVMIWADQYQIEVDGARFNSGVALLKVIIRESHLDTNATTNQIRTKLSSLDTYVATVNGDIGKLNQYAKLLVQSLAARNQTTSDLLINLFKGYGAVSDEGFRAWLLRKQDDHEEGNPLTPDGLMIAAKNKYDTMVEKGTWNAPTAEEKIVALEAKLTSSMKTLNKKVSFEMSKKGGKKSSDQKKAPKSGQKGDHPKQWPPPKKGDKKMVEYEGYNWWWCGKTTGGKCECWRAHDPKECRGGAAASDKTKPKNKGKRPFPADDKKKKDSNAKRLKVAKAYVSKMEEQNGNTSTDEEYDTE